MELIDAPSAISETTSGVIVIRCEDYLGPARGTLTTVADTKSVAGTVAKDTQDIAVAVVATSITNRWALASDTLRIPFADITALYDTSASGVYVLLGLKVLGEAPLTAQIGSTFYGWVNNGYGPTVAFGRDTTYFNSIACVPKSVWGDQYRIAGPFTIFESDLSGATNMTVRAWGLTGGDIELYLDVIYLIPFGGLWTGVYNVNNFQPLEFFQNGVLFNDQDNDTSDNILGKHSVVWAGPKTAIPYPSVSLTDFQSANDEPTAYDLHKDLWDGSSASPPLLDPKSHLMVMCAPLYLPSQTIISEPFDDTHSTGNYLTDEGYSKTFRAGNFTGGASGWYEPGTGWAEFVALGGQTGNFYPHADLAFGAYGAVAGTLPHQGNAVLTDLEDCVQLFSFAIQESDHLKLVAGVCGSPLPLVPSFSQAVEGVLIDNGSGALTISLVSHDTRVPLTQFGGDQFRRTFGSPSSYEVTGSYTPGDIYWCRIERRRYYWRVRCWADGDTEPSTWQITGRASYLYRNSTTSVIDWVDYPYDTSWSSDADHDVLYQHPFRNWGVPVIIGEAGSENQTDNTARIYQYELSIDSGGSSPGDMHLAEVKYDYSIQFDQITIPFGSWRMVDAGYRKRHFNADANGFNLNAWKDASSPELQSSCIPLVWELVVDAKILSLSHLRVATRYGDRVTVRT